MSGQHGIKRCMVQGLFDLLQASICLCSSLLGGLAGCKPCAKYPCVHLVHALQQGLSCGGHLPADRFLHLATTRRFGL